MQKQNFYFEHSRSTEQPFGEAELTEDQKLLWTLEKDKGRDTVWDASAFRWD